MPNSKIYSTDVSVRALEVALANCYKHNVADRVTLLKGSLLEPLPEAADIIIANLPYVKRKDIPEKICEPITALDGSKNGTLQIERLLPEVADKLRPGGSLLIEIGLGQSGFIVMRINNLYPDSKVEVLKDLAGIERVIWLTID